MSLARSGPGGDPLLIGPQPPIKKKQRATLKITLQHLMILLLLLNLGVAGVWLYAINQADNQMQINAIQANGDAMRVQALRTMGIKGNKLPEAQVKQAQDALSAAQGSVPVGFSSLGTIDYLFQVAQRAGVTLQTANVGTTSNRGGIFSTPVDVQLSAQSPAAILAFVQDLNGGSRLAMVEMNGLDLSPGNKQESMTVAFYTRSSQ